MGADRDSSAGQHFAEAVRIMARLRGDNGCPWDREQSFESIQKHTLEETYEVFDAIERRDWANLKEELGDLLLQILFYAQLASEAARFDIAEVVEGLNRKLVRRHPHVFGEQASAAAGNSVSGALPTTGIDSAQVLRNWDAIKLAESRAAENAGASTEGETGTAGTQAGTHGRLASISRALPALMESQKLGSRAAKSGFDWPNSTGLFAKLQEETRELHEAIAGQDVANIEDEVGDLLFTAVNLARHLKVDAEMALRHTNAKFRSRFGAMEMFADQPLEQLDAPELEALWSRAKALEAGPAANQG